MHTVIHYLIQTVRPKHKSAILLLSAVLAATTNPAAAGTWYVATNGDNSAGTSWQTAYTNLQTVLNNARTNDTVYVAGHTFSSASTLMWTNTLAPGLSLLGGYAATNNADQPGPSNPDLWATVLRPANSGRVVYASGLSNAILRGVTISGGYTNATVVQYSMGLYATNCRALTIDSCTFTNNRCISNQRTQKGGGLTLETSSVLLTNCLFTLNTAGGTGNGDGYGGGLYVASGTMTMTLCRVTANTAGAGLNYGPMGGGLYLAAPSTNVIIRSVISRNTSTNNIASGGGIHTLGKTTLINCLVDHNNTDSDNGDGIYLGGGSLSLINCTVADNSGVGIMQGAGTASLSNTIVWGHSDDLKGFSSDGQLPPTLTNVWYSCIQNGDNMGRQGCFSFDPLFANTNFYHLQSKQGVYSNGYFNGGTWSVSPSNSACIDLGSPTADTSLEPLPNGGRINLGAYAGTEVASLSDTTTVFTIPAIANGGWVLAGHRTITLMAQVTDTGAQTPQCGFGYWIGAGPTSSVSAGPQNGAFTLDIGGLSPGNSYQFAAFASNAAGIAWSTAQAFATHPSPDSFYVATNGNNTAGTSWTSAYTSLQGALNLLEPGDVLYLAGHSFVVNPGYQQESLWTWQGRSGATVIGGYAATNDAVLPGGQNSVLWPTVLTRTSGTSRILLASTLTNCILREVTLRNGYFNIERDGGGLYISNCINLTVDSCTIISNTIPSATPINSIKGGGVFVASGVVTITNSLIASNSLPGVPNSYSYGGGLYLNAGTTTVTRSRIIGNSCRGDGGRQSFGGGIYVNSGAAGDLRQTIISGNKALNGSTVPFAASTLTRGGAIYNLGRLTLANCLIDHNSDDKHTSDGIWTSNRIEVVNCTIADNYGVGIYATNTTVAITNSILWTNIDDIIITGSGTALVAYCDIQTPDSFWTNGINGCISADPLFADSIYYHEQSAGGYYVNGYFSGGSWNKAAGQTLSPCIDAGDPASDYSLEPAVRGKAINLGAYGNTDVASKTYALAGTLLLLQ